ncbi:MAG: hypothetical protein K6346_03360 [Halothiobacillaceae bacterium]
MHKIDPVLGDIRDVDIPAAGGPPPMFGLSADDPDPYAMIDEALAEAGGEAEGEDEVEDEGEDDLKDYGDDAMDAKDDEDDEDDEIEVEIKDDKAMGDKDDKADAADALETGASHADTDRTTQGADGNDAAMAEPESMKDASEAGLTAAGDAAQTPQATSLGHIAQGLPQAGVMPQGAQPQTKGYGVPLHGVSAYAPGPVYPGLPSGHAMHHSAPADLGAALSGLLGLVANAAAGVVKAPFVAGSSLLDAYRANKADEAIKIMEARLATAEQMKKAIFSDPQISPMVERIREVQAKGSAATMEDMEAMRRAKQSLSERLWEDDMQRKLQDLDGAIDAFRDQASRAMMAIEGIKDKDGHLALFLSDRMGYLAHRMEGLGLEMKDLDGHHGRLDALADRCLAITERLREMLQRLGEMLAAIFRAGASQAPRPSPSM